MLAEPPARLGPGLDISPLPAVQPEDVAESAVSGLVTAIRLLAALAGAELGLIVWLLMP